VQSLADSLDDAVASAGLNPAAARPLPAMLDALDPARQGHYKADVGGQSPLKHQAGSRKAGQPAERPARPHLQFDAARDFFQCTPGAAVHAAAGGQQLLAQDNMLFAAAQTQQAVSGLGSQLFTHRGGVRAVAGRGPVSLRAHDGELDIQADGVVRVSSQQAGIDIQAKELISLTAGQCQIELNGPNINISCPGVFTVQGAAHQFKGPASDVASLDDSATQSPGVPHGKVGARKDPDDPGQSVAGRHQDTVADPQAEPASAAVKDKAEDPQATSPVSLDERQVPRALVPRSRF
jgi:type VI secretion system secreted protein VgrG